MRALLDADILIWHLRGERKAADYLRKLAVDPDIELWTGAMQRAEVLFFMRPQEEEQTMMLLSRVRTVAVDQAIVDEAGRLIGTRVHRPDELYESIEGIPPDLVVYFGDLKWRSIGTVGWNQIHFHENDTGPDDANHAPYGIYISHPADTVAADRSIREIRGIVLDHFGIATNQGSVKT